MLALSGVFKFSAKNITHLPTLRFFIFFYIKGKGAPTYAVRHFLCAEGEDISYDNLCSFKHLLVVSLIEEGANRAYRS